MSTPSMIEIYEYTILRKRDMRQMYGTLILSRGMGRDLSLRRVTTQREPII
jgi:hypothetical protein